MLAQTNRLPDKTRKSFMISGHLRRARYRPILGSRQPWL